MMVKAEVTLKTLLEAYRDLRREIRDVYHYLEKPRPAIAMEEAHDWAESLAQELLKLHDKLFRYFHQEELAGGLDQVVLEFPYAERSLNALHDENEVLLRDVRTIIQATMSYAEGKPLPDPALRRRTASLLRKFAEHEEKKTSLIWQLHCEDLGTID